MRDDLCSTVLWFHVHLDLFALKVGAVECFDYVSVIANFLFFSSPLLKCNNSEEGKILKSPSGYSPTQHAL